MTTAEHSPQQEMKGLYLGTVRLLERLHRQFLELIDVELDRLKVEDINNVQSLIRFHTGKGTLRVGGVLTRGYYLGSNVSYNVRKLVETGYVVQERSVHDRRSSRVFLSDKGLKLHEQLNEMFDGQVQAFNEISSAKDLDAATATFKRLGGVWHPPGRSTRRARFQSYHPPAAVR